MIIHAMKGHDISKTENYGLLGKAQMFWHAINTLREKTFIKANFIVKIFTMFVDKKNGQNYDIKIICLRSIQES